MEKVLGRPVLLTNRGGKAGGGARLTPEARRFVRILSRWQRDVERLSLRAFARAVESRDR
jgi:molybdate transport repressor ModE-like protein